jgi:hypothetical protein
MELPQRFWDKVDKTAPGGCWLWIGAKQEGGRKGSGKLQGRFRFNGKAQLVHKISLESHLGRELTEGMVTCHNCKSDLCVNPGHLREDTQSNNAKDMIRDGTSTRGEINPANKLTQEQVIAIRSITGKLQREIAEEYGVARKTISDIILRKTWGWL